MSEHITDEELTDMERWLANAEQWQLADRLIEDVPLLIAALRESRAEVERLQRIVEGWGKVEFSSRWAGPV